ncbi:MAG TPA: emopamil-binding family protein [Gemmatimonadaceae bacterium]|jgi:hypothetical protein|nr:emopamil-binding family protein [Gemmatimonadaceae bacterium]
MTRRDRSTIALLGFFVLIAMTLELYFLACHRDLPARVATQLPARLFGIYSVADRSYFDPVSALALSLEGLNVFVMQPLCGLVVYAIVRGRGWRWPLQLGVSAYLAMSVVLYFTVAIVSGYADMAVHSGKAFALLYGANMPWLLGYGWLALDAAREIARRLATEPAQRRRTVIALQPAHS